MKKLFTYCTVATIMIFGSSFNQPDAKNYYETGLNSLNQKDYIKAIGDFTNAISMNPKFGDAYYYRAYSKELLGKKMGFVSSELCSDLIYSMVYGKEEASEKIDELCTGECFNMESAFVEPEIVYCADFSSKILTDLPDGVESFTYLIKLNMFNNKLVTLSQKWAYLDKLISLDLSSNRITLVPPVIGKLTSLKELNLNKNQLSTLPAEIGNLKNLKTLTLRQNGLKVLPPNIGTLTQLETLDLALNMLSTLPAEVENLKNLKKLILVGNEISAKEQQRIKTLLPNTQISFE
ncbi:leucine-rich repeat domain-containing protein [Cytophaga sp.]|uniref:leucine-rich repeat domain-containing protein n=1 Tax=Cytophaga sp. TaxID=29535 RepID=UPI003F81BCFA